MKQSVDILDILRAEGFKPYLNSFTRIYLNVMITVAGYKEFGQYDTLNVVVLEISEDLRTINVAGYFEGIVLLLGIPATYIRRITHNPVVDPVVDFNTTTVKDIIREIREGHAREAEISIVNGE